MPYLSAPKCVKFSFLNVYFQWLGFLTKLDVIRAKVPILRFYDSITNLEVDLNFNNIVGIRNTHLLKTYAQCK
jgi:DNA polymerase sigma